LRGYVKFFFQKSFGKPLFCRFSGQAVDETGHFCYNTSQMKGVIPMSKFSTRLIELRKERSMTQSDLAKVMGKTRSTVSGYETEGKEPDYEMLCSFAEYFGVTLDYLLGREDVKTHTDVVFQNDNVNFKRGYDALPQEMKQTVATLFDDFYVLLNRDVKTQNAGRLSLYGELMHKIQTSRNEVKGRIERGGEHASDPLFLSEIMQLQNNLKNEVAALFDKLMQADMETAYELKKDGKRESSKGSAI
jgi:transcriptional regulator with XRE-family HTH domain